MDNFTTYTQTITLKDIYGSDYKVPYGYKIIAFRPPLKGELYLDVLKKVEISSCEYKSPRIIVELVPQAKGKKWVVEVLENEARTLKPGEVGVRSLNNLSLVFWPEHISFNTSEKYYPVKITGE